MLSMLGWMLGIGLSVVGLVLSAAARQNGVHLAWAHMVIAATVCISFALLAVVHNQRLRGEGASRSAVAASTARHMGLVWTWGALALMVTYGTGVLTWKEWRAFFLAFFIGAGVCLFLSAALAKDAASGR